MDPILSYRRLVALPKPDNPKKVERKGPRRELYSLFRQLSCINITGKEFYFREIRESIFREIGESSLGTLENQV